MKQEQVYYWAHANGDKPGPWQTIEGTPKSAIEKATLLGAAFFSTFGFEYEPAKDKEEPYRYGDLVFDFDNEDDPEIAREHAIELVRHLMRYDVDPEDLRYFLSGKKGFHVAIPHYIIGSSKGDPMLPKIYSKIVDYMIVRLWMDGPCTIDTSMYAMGKGKLLRMKNVKRDNGAYKVPITWSELQGTNYQELILKASAPREILLKPYDWTTSDKLFVLYTSFKRREHEPSSSKLVDAAKFVKRCGFVRHCLENAAHLEEPKWHALLSIVKGLGNDGIWLAHDLSCTYRDYKHQNILHKMERVEPNYSCEKIKANLYNCGCNCGVSSPSKLWTKASSQESQDAIKHTDSTKLLEITDQLDLYPSSEGIPYADIVIDNCRKTFQIETKEFKNLIGFLFYRSAGKPLKNTLAADLIQDLTARAIHGPHEPRKIYTRIAHVDDAVYIDLCDDSWRAIEITANGWSIINTPPVRFRRLKSMQPLNEPIRGGQVSELINLLNIDEEEAILVIAWLLGTLCPGPFPILTLEGEQGTAKSSTTRMLRQLIDPSIAPTRATPRNLQDLIIAASSSHILALDNMSGVPLWLSDALCRIATGDSFAARKLFTNDEESIISVIKPIILNGIDQIAERHDLADRSLRVSLPVIPAHKRKPEALLDAAFKEAAPKILGGLCEGVACALKNRHKVKTNNLPRMADFALWCYAAEEVMPWEEGEFLEKYTLNQNESIQSALESDDIANSIKLLMKRTSFWQGSPTELLNELTGIIDEKISQLKYWPKTPAMLGRRLTRTQAFLRKSGIDITREKGGNRIITIRTTSEHKDTPTEKLSIDTLFE